jgi:hypothetical protein
MDTKLKADIAESAVITELLRHGFNVLRPYGDRLPYDVAVEQNGCLVRIQIKSAWFESGSKRFKVDARQTKTNRRIMVRKHYSDNDFDFAVIYVSETNDFFIIPVAKFISYRSTVTIAEGNNGKVKQDRMRLKQYRNRWDLISGSLSSNG